MTRATYIVEAVRTPIGRYGGALAAVRPDDLAALAVGEVVRRVPTLDPARIDEVILGDANGAGEDNRNVASARWSGACRRLIRRASMRSSSATPTEPERTTATWRAWRSCSPGCQPASRGPPSIACVAQGSRR